MKMTVIVARADDAFSQNLREAGIEVVNLELIRSEVIEDLSEFENLISRLDEYDGVFFTSPVAAAVLAAHVLPPVRPKIYALGNRAVSVLKNAGFEPEAGSTGNTSEELVASYGLEEFTGKRLLFIRGDRSMRTIPDRLAGVATLDEFTVYRTVQLEPAEEVAAAVRQGSPQWICFFSPSAVEAFEKRFGVGEVTVAAIGDTTAARARALGFEIGLVASKATNSIFAQELLTHLSA